MKRCFFVLGAVLAFAIGARAVETNTAVIAAPHEGRSMARHLGFLEIAKQGGVDLLFVGDSITDYWFRYGRSIWDANFAPLHAANFGVAGDRTEHVLWRLQNGELDGIKPKLVVLMIGTNNLGSNSDEEIADGIKAIIQQLRQKLPSSQILLLGIFPRGEQADNPVRSRIKHINSIIAKFDDGKMIKYMDIGPKFLEPDGTLSKSAMPDSLHPNAKGYQIWADAITPTVQEMMK